MTNLKHVPPGRPQNKWLTNSEITLTDPLEISGGTLSAVDMWCNETTVLATADDTDPVRF